MQASSLVRKAIRDSHARFPRNLALTYCAISVLWILFSDAALFALNVPESILAQISAYKGLAFVALTSILIFDISRRYLKRADDALSRSIESSHELIERLVVAGEFRDDDTGNHNRRIGEYARVIAEKLGLPEEECELIYYGAKLHDVGKIGVPDSILRKNGPLTPDERQIMERHVLFGASILGHAHSVHIQIARTIALSHHESWDGTGYPNQLIGIAIPLEGRIVAVCDVYDALTSTRPYKAAWSEEDALAEIHRLSGTKFDPIIVRAFEQSMDKIRVIREEAQSPVAQSLKKTYPLPVVSKQSDTCAKCTSQICPTCFYKDRAA